VGRRRLKGMPVTRALLAAVRQATRTTSDAAARQHAFLLAFDWARGFFYADAAGAAAATATAGGAEAAFDFCTPADFPSLCAVLVEGLTDVWSATRKGCAGRLFGVLDGMALGQVT
jgi:hypothetical protein